MLADPRPDCRCGHPWEVHQHFRDNDDCGLCGRPVCPTYRAPHVPLLERLKAWWRR